MKFLILLTIITTAIGAKLPSAFTKCSKQNLDTCLVKAVENGIHELAQNSYKEMGLLSLNPIEMKYFFCGFGKGPVQFNQTYENSKQIGFANTKCAKASFDFGRKIFEIDCTVPQLIWTSIYQYVGKIFTTPISAKGNGKLTMDNVRITLKMPLEEYEKGGKKFFRLKSVQCGLQLDLVVFVLENLSAEMNKLFNNHWLQLFGDIRVPYEKQFGELFASVFESVLAQVSIDELFLE